MNLESLKNNVEISTLKFTDIKSKVCSLEEEYCSEVKEHLIEIAKFLKQDKRKNVKSLSNRILKFIQKHEDEINRVKGMYNFDKSFGKYTYIAGVDEVGRGPLAGPIVAASVILDLNYKNYNDLILGIKDSKKLSQKSREELSQIIKSKALYYNIVEIDNDIIDSKGIGWCNNEVLKRSSMGLDVKPQLVISDGYAIKDIKFKMNL